jgi:Family of unknown function (DUF5305)
MKVWRSFARSRRLRIACFALAGALLVASVVGLGLSAALTGEITAVNYEHRGQFGYTVYLKPSILYGDVTLTQEEQEEEVPMVFFRDIMTKVNLYFTYNFGCSQSLSNVTNKLVLSVIAEDPGLWQKEMTQLEETRAGTEFAVNFTLDLSKVDSMFDDIEADIGITGGSTRNFIIRAVVNTTAETALGQTIEDEFSYELTAVLTAKKLELTGNLGSSKEGSKEGIKYKGNGRFDYEVHLKPNKLYETDVLKSEAPSVVEPPASPQTLGPGLVYFPKIIDKIAASFSYQFLCDRPISEQSQEVQVTAIIENPGQWSKSLVVVPKTNKVGNFTISFPIDIEYFTMVIDAIGQETGVRVSSPNIVIKTDVYTVAHTDLGTINEVYTQTLSGKLDANTLSFDKELSGSKLGSIGAPASEASRGGSRTPWIIGLVIALLALGYFGWSQTQLRVAPVSAGEAEAARARKKYRQMMVDVEELPWTKPTETVIPLNSLDDLVRIADDLVKPVLHQAEKGTHTYCIIDSDVRYVYEIKT